MKFEFLSVEIKKKRNRSLGFFKTRLIKLILIIL